MITQDNMFEMSKKETSLEINLTTISHLEQTRNNPHTPKSIRSIHSNLPFVLNEKHTNTQF